MVKLHDINETAVFSWSYDALPLVATGTLAGVIDDDFSSDSNLSIYDPFSVSNDVKESKPIFSASAPSKFNSLDWSKPSDEYSKGILACGLENSSIQLYNPQTLISDKPKNLVDAKIAEYKKHTTSVLTVKFNPLQSQILASSGSKGELFIWDVKKGTSFSPGQAISPLGKITSLDWNNKMSHIFGTAGDSGYSSIWDLKAKREVLQLNYSNINLSVIRWHPNQSTKLVTASDSDNEPVILTWDLRNSSAPEKILKGHKKGVLSLDWCLDDPNLLLSSGKDDSTFLWNPIEGTQLASYPSSSNWVHQTKFAPKIPEVFASASLSKKIVIQSLQDTNKVDENKRKSQTENDFWNEISTTEIQQPSIKIQQAPLWLKRPVSATFGYGGKLVIAKKNSVKITKISSETELDKSAKEMINAISTKDFNNLCDSKINSSNNLKENSDWSLLKKMLDDISIEELLDIKDDSKEEPTSEASSTSTSNELIDDEDFFAQIGNNNTASNTTTNKIESKTFIPYIPSGKFNLFSKSSNEFETNAIKLLLSNEIDNLLDLCIENGHILEALVIAMNGSDEEKEKAKDAYFKKYADNSSFARLLYSSSNGSLSDVVQNADISSWKDIVKSIITFSKNKASFNVEMKLLGDRLLDSKLENCRDSALSCYVAASALDKVSNVWLSELNNYEKFYLQNENEDGSKNTVFEARFKALGEVIEKIVVFQSKSLDSINGDLVGLGHAFVEYADSLVNFGHYELAYKILNLISDSIPAIKIEKDRISKAFISTATLPSANTAANKYAIPVTQQQIMQQQIQQQQREAQSRAQEHIQNHQLPHQFQPAMPLPPQPHHPVQQQQPTLPPPQQQHASQPHTVQKRNPYVVPAAVSSPITATNGTFNQAPPNPYAKFAANSPSLSPNATMNTPLAAPYQPAATNGVMNNTKANPYAPKTAMDSLQNPPSYSNGINGIGNSAPPTIPAFSKEPVLPPSMKKDVGGWNDLPTHLAPVIKKTTPVSASTNNTKHSSSRSVSQAPAIPPPPSKHDLDQQPPQQPVIPYAKIPKNPYAPKPEVIEPVRSPVYPRSPFTPQPSSSAIKTQSNKNPYAPKHSSNNAYIPETQQFQQQPVQPNILHPMQSTSFNANSMPPPPSYVKPSGVLPPPSKKNSISSPVPVAANTFSNVATVTAAVPSVPSTPDVPPNPQSLPNPEPIISILTSELEKVKPNIPAKFEKQLIDAEKRLNILFNHLKQGDLLTTATVQKLIELSVSLRDGDYDKALALREEISTNNENECGSWMVGVNRLIGMVKATSR